MDSRTRDPRLKSRTLQSVQYLLCLPHFLQVKGNILTLNGVDTKHEGMYQCEAKNNLGMARSSAQVRSLSE